MQHSLVHYDDFRTESALIQVASPLAGDTRRSWRRHNRHRSAFVVFLRSQLKSRRYSYGFSVHTLPLHILKSCYESKITAEDPRAMLHPVTDVSRYLPYNKKRLWVMWCLSCSYRNCCSEPTGTITYHCFVNYCISSLHGLFIYCIIYLTITTQLLPKCRYPLGYSSYE